MFFKKPRHRIFEYPPRFYKPEEDQDERRKRKLGFRRHQKIKKHKRSPLVWGVLALLAIYIYLKLTGVV